MITKPPTAAVVSRLLTNAGFLKAIPFAKEGEGEGFEVSNAPMDSGVAVYWRGSGSCRSAQLARYADALDAAGLRVRAKTYKLIVTAGEAAR